MKHTLWGVPQFATSSSAGKTGGKILCAAVWGLPSEIPFEMSPQYFSWVSPGIEKCSMEAYPLSYTGILSCPKEENSMSEEST
jgi:hypothetical protein